MATNGVAPVVSGADGGTGGSGGEAPPTKKKTKVSRPVFSLVFDTPEFVLLHCV